MKSLRVIYAKGGRAIAEAERLFPFAGTTPDGGPDKYLLGVLGKVGESPFRLISFGPECKRREILGRDVIEYGTRPKSLSFIGRRWAYISESVQFLVDTIKWKPSHILCGIDGPFAVFAYISAKLTGSKFFFLAHNALKISSTSIIYKFSHELIVKRSDVVIVHGPFLYDQAVALGAAKDRIFEFNNGLDDGHKKIIASLPIRSTHLNERALKTFIYVGRMEEDKGIYDLFNAFLNIKTKFPSKLIYVGTGGCLLDIRNKVINEKLEDFIEVLGHVPHETIFSLMRQADVVVTPTQSKFPEGRCMSVMEAFFVGTPVIAPNYGPFPYLVKNSENGFLFTPDSVVELTSAMARIADSKTLNMIRKGAEISGRELMGPQKSFFQVIDSVLK